MLAQGVVIGFPAVELDGAEEALYVVGRVLGRAVKEAGACELWSEESVMSASHVFVQAATYLFN